MAERLKTSFDPWAVVKRNVSSINMGLYTEIVCGHLRSMQHFKTHSRSTCMAECGAETLYPYGIAPPSDKMNIPGRMGPGFFPAFR